MNTPNFGDLSSYIDQILASRGVSKYQVMAFYEDWHKNNPKGIPEFIPGSKQESNAFITELQNCYRQRLVENKDVRFKSK